MNIIIRPDFFLLVDLRDFFFSDLVGGGPSALGRITRPF